MTPPTFSIIIPSHNRPQMLRRVVTSALAQTDPDFEIWVIDDASEPPAAQAIPDLLTDARVQVHRQEPNGGAAVARNTGASLARGEVLVFVDDDDEITPDYLAGVRAVFDSSPPRVGWVGGSIRHLRDTAHGVETVRDEHWAENLAGPGRAHEKLMATPTTRFCFSGLAVKRVAFEAVDGFDTAYRCSEDREFLMRLSGKSDVAPLHAVGVLVHHHDGPKLNRYSKKMAESYRRIVETHYTQISQNPQALMAFAYKTAWLHYQVGENKTARRFAKMALKSRPISGRTWTLIASYEIGRTHGSEIHTGISTWVKTLKRSLGRELARGAKS